MIQGIGSAGLLPQMSQLPSGRANGPLAKVAQSFTNAEGQNLLDIKDDLQSAVKDAVRSGNPTEVKDALRGVLEDNGFDADEVMSALESARPRRGGQPFGGPGLSGSVEPASMMKSLFQRLPAGSIVSTKA